MTDQELETQARNLLERTLTDAPSGRRLVQRDSVADSYPGEHRRISDHFFSVLNQGSDVTVFFDTAGQVSGWRDDGRRGTMMALEPNREALLAAVRSELELTGEAWLGEVKPVVLPPAGWTHQAVVFTRRSPGRGDVVRVWVDPQNLRIIQCLYGAGQ
jgi:hypothetical protein